MCALQLLTRFVSVCHKQCTELLSQRPSPFDGKVKQVYVMLQRQLCLQELPFPRRIWYLLCWKNRLVGIFLRITSDRQVLADMVTL